jgi:hypothetical protein
MTTFGRATRPPHAREREIHELRTEMLRIDERVEFVHTDDKKWELCQATRQTRGASR